MRAALLKTAAFLLTLLLAGCATADRGAPSPQESEYLLRMEPSAGGYRLGSEFRLDAPKNESFEYRGRQAGHLVYHSKLVTGGERWKYTDILLHVGPAGRVNKIVLLRQFASLQGATEFYETEYRRQRERYYLTEDSGNSGTLRYAKVEAYPDRATWEGAYRRHLDRGESGPFHYYYHPLIATRTASFVYLRGVPTVAMIYEGHGYPGGAE
jgi:hypothetical protein